MEPILWLGGWGNEGRLPPARVSGHHKLHVIEAVWLWTRLVGESAPGGPDPPAAAILRRSVRLPTAALRAAVSGRSRHCDLGLRTGGKREDRAPALMGGGDGCGRGVGRGRARRTGRATILAAADR